MVQYQLPQFHRAATVATILFIFSALAGIDFSSVAVDTVFSQAQPSMQCALITIIPDDLPEDFENFTVTITEVGQYEYDEVLMGINDRLGLALFPNSTTAIIEGKDFFLEFAISFLVTQTL